MQPLHFPFPEPPPPAATLEVAPGIHWLRMPLPFALNHINLWLLKDGDGWTIVDCGYGIERTQTLWEEIFTRKLDGKRVHKIIVTHYHPDHVGCCAWLAQRLGCEVWMTEGEFLSTHAVRAALAGFSRELAITHFTSHGLPLEKTKAQETRGNSYARGVPGMVEQFRRIAEGDEIEIDGRAWRIIIGRGHAPEHAMLYCEALGVLISGDQVLPRITTNVGVWPNQPEGDPLRLFLESMHKFEGLPRDTLVLPSHDRVFVGLQTRLEQLRSHHTARLAEVEAACDTPKSAVQLLPVLFHRELDDHQLMFAMGESIAHLNYLMYARRLRRALDGDGIFRFARD
jgi:glyoxylase-like metal-dependent hydrolase (beta-lactamase superfamily II)